MGATYLISGMSLLMAAILEVPSGCGKSDWDIGERDGPGGLSAVCFVCDDERWQLRDNS